MIMIGVQKWHGMPAKLYSQGCLIKLIFICEYCFFDAYYCPLQLQFVRKEWNLKSVYYCHSSFVYVWKTPQWIIHLLWSVWLKILSEIQNKYTPKNMYPHIHFLHYLVECSRTVHGHIQCFNYQTNAHFWNVTEPNNILNKISVVF